jgi:hypothetical protein
MNYTKGPWEVYDPAAEEGEENYTFGINGADGTAVVWYGEGQGSGIRKESDAHMIAAATCLYEELKETHAALCFKDNEYIGSERYKRNAAALAKAEGREV